MSGLGGRLGQARRTAIGGQVFSTRGLTSCTPMSILHFLTAPIHIFPRHAEAEQIAAHMRPTLCAFHALVHEVPIRRFQIEN